jgi:hypothetical protein
VVIARDPWFNGGRNYGSEKELKTYGRKPDYWPMGTPPKVQYTLASPPVFQRVGQASVAQSLRPQKKPRAQSTPSLHGRWKTEGEAYKPMFMPQRHAKVEPEYNDKGRLLRREAPDYTVPKAFTGIP